MVTTRRSKAIFSDLEFSFTGDVVCDSDILIFSVGVNLGIAAARVASQEPSGYFKYNSLTLKQKTSFLVWTE